MKHSEHSEMPPYPQGEPPFVPLLKKHTPFIPHWAERRSAEDCETLPARGVFLKPCFPDPEHLLDTVYDDWKRFLAEAKLEGGEIPVETKFQEGMEHEAYRLRIETDRMILSASGPEGIRRGLYYLRDQIAGSPYLKLRDVVRTPWLKNRISRCFFGPIKRPPFNIDELMNDIDYYPDEYLRRLAQEGVNGLWLTIAFREICDTTIRKAPPEAARRIARLRATVEHCRRYGIKIWVFCIEPIYWSLSNGNPVPPECAELLGPGYSAQEAGEEMNSFCIHSEKARTYLYEAVNFLFRAVPHLGGMITISYGERLTSCLNKIDIHSDGEIPCSKRCDLSPGEILAEILRPMKKGMRDADPDAELISWLYMPQAEQFSSWIAELPSELPSDVIMAFNFESGVTKRQLGAVRTGGDYWLSETGPSDRFILMAEAAKGHCEFAAKLQVACSHECATVPCIPAPGLLYRKYRRMKKLGVRHVIQCWYFGNYPGVMNEAAGKLAWEDFSSSEDAFLESLARPEWGSGAAAVVQAWKQFAEAYSNYPLDNQFQYYGPMHDGPVWPLHLHLSMTPLPRSWKPETFPAGDAMGECVKHFELHELVELTGRLSSGWKKGMALLRQAGEKGHELDFSLAGALEIQFHSAHNILKFYMMRNTLLDSPPDAASILDAMKQIVHEEIANSLRLAELCRGDPRLGYHSEAEVYKYFPARLEWRAETLRHLLEHDFPEAEAALARGIGIGSFLDKKGEGAVAGKKCGSNGIHWSFEYEPDTLTFHLDFTGVSDHPESAFLFFMDRKGACRPPDPVRVDKNSENRTPDGWHCDIRIPREMLRCASVFYFGIERVEYKSGAVTVHANDPEGASLHENRLYLGLFGADKLRRIELHPLSGAAKHQVKQKRKVRPPSR